jgi:hypothetical protein
MQFPQGMPDTVLGIDFSDPCFANKLASSLHVMPFYSTLWHIMFKQQHQELQSNL